MTGESIVKKKILLIGGDGFIGRNLLGVLKKTGFEVQSTNQSDCSQGEIKFCLGTDSPSKLSLESLDFLVLCAAKTSSSYIEENKDQSWKINVEAVCDLVSRVKSERTKILFLSSDSVFNINQRERNEFSKPFPSSTYGRHKQTVERFLLDAYCDQTIIIRLTKVLAKYSPICKPLFSHNKDQFKDFRYRKNYFFSPITLKYCLINIMRIIELSRVGVFHLSSEKMFSSYKLFHDLATDLNIVCENEVFFNEKEEDSQEQYMCKSYLDMQHTSHELCIEPEKYVSIIKYLAK